MYLSRNLMGTHEPILYPINEESSAALTEVVGGPPTYLPSNQMLMFNTTTKTWAILTMDDKTCPLPRTNHSTAFDRKEG